MRPSIQPHSRGGVKGNDALPSKHQLAAFSALKSGKDFAIRAVAGSGKTTTLVASARQVPQNVVTALTFGKADQKALANRLPPNASASTTHSFGLKAVRRAWGPVAIDAGRDIRIAQSAAKKVFGTDRRPIGWEGEGTAAAAITKGARAAKQALAVSADQLWGIASRVAPAVRELRAELAEGIRQALLSAAEPDGSVSFDDMLWAPVVRGMPVPKAEVLFVDEAQDLTPCQRDLIERIPRRQTVAVGDPMQAIYVWRGAGVDSMDRMIELCGGKVLPLPVSYRAPKRVAELVRARFVRDFESRDGAPAGSIVIAPGSARSARPGDLVLSRTNRPLISLALELIDAGVPALVRSGLNERAHSVAGKTDMEEAEDFIDEQLELLQTDDEDESKKAAPVRDEWLAIQNLLTRCRNIDEARRLIGLLLPKRPPERDNGRSVVLSTVHRAKGREADRVIILANTLFAFWGDPDEEQRIAYVAVTRAKRDLVFDVGDANAADGGDRCRNEGLDSLLEVVR